MDLSSRLRAIVKGGPPAPTRELTYEPDDGYRNAAALDLDRVASTLGGRRIDTRFGECLVVDRRYESDRWHGGIRIGDCELADVAALAVLDPALAPMTSDWAAAHGGRAPRTIFIDLETLICSPETKHLGTSLIGGQVKGCGGAR